jgi:conjugative relaxase-like TrwC/TraI family protein
VRPRRHAGEGEAPGRWQGRGLAALGLADGARVEERELEVLFGRALHPVTGEPLGRAWRVDGVTGYDLTFSAPKSVSALWALGDDRVNGQGGGGARGRGAGHAGLPGHARGVLPARL